MEKKTIETKDEIRTLDLGKSVYELCEEYPGLIDAMEALGFAEITKKGALSTVGRFMTIPNAVAMQGLSMEQVAEALREQGFALAEAADAPEAGAAQAADGAAEAGTAPAPGGALSPEQALALLDALPLELTFIDAAGAPRYRSAAAEGPARDGFPPEGDPFVRGVLDDLRAGIRERVELWDRREDEPVLVRWLAVRDRAGKYLGALECVQPMGFAERHFRGGDARPADLPRKDG